MSKVTEEDLEDFKEYRGEKFFLLTISDIWSATNGDTKYDINWEPLFSNEILQELKKEKYPILFDSSGEYCTKSNFNTLDSFCKHVDANPNDVYVCLNNTQSVQLTSNINKYNFFSFDRYAFDAVQVSYNMSKILYNFSFNDRKRFLFLNRRYSIERAYMYFSWDSFNSSAGLLRLLKILSKWKVPTVICRVGVCSVASNKLRPIFVFGK